MPFRKIVMIMSYCASLFSNNVVHIRSDSRLCVFVVPDVVLPEVTPPSHTLKHTNTRYSSYISSRSTRNISIPSEKTYFKEVVVPYRQIEMIMNYCASLFSNILNKIFTVLR